MDLQEFIIHYVQAKDAFHKTLKSYEEKEGFIEFEFKTGKIPYYISKDISTINLESIKNIPKKFIICDNTLKNVEYLISNWKSFAEITGLIVMFANSEQNEKWLINTNMHSRVTEEKDIKSGLLGLFNNVPPVIN